MCSYVVEVVLFLFSRSSSFCFRTYEEFLKKQKILVRVPEENCFLPFHECVLKIILSHEWMCKEHQMCLQHGELDDAVITALRRLFLFKYLTVSVNYLQIQRGLFNLTGFRPFLMMMKALLPSSRCVQWQIIDFSMMWWCRAEFGCFDPVLE